MIDKKKVLLISYYWPPSGGSGVQRWVKFCKYLPDFEIEPIVLTVENGTYPLTDSTLEEEVSPNLKVYKSKSIEPYSLFGKILGQSANQVSTPSTAFSDNGNILKKFGVWVRANFFIPDARIGWIPFTVKKASEIIYKHNIETIITTGPPNSTHLIGLKLVKKNPKLNWIMDMRDPWTQIFYNQDLPRHSFASKKDLELEKKALKHADEVILVSKSVQDIQKEIYDRGYQIVTNGFDHTEFSVTSESNRKDILSIKYIGSMTESAIPYNFFNALKELDKKLQKRVKIDFIGSINSKVTEIIRSQDLNHIVHFSKYLPHLEAKNEMQTSDVLLLTIPNTKNSNAITPGKIFDYIGAHKPILCIGPNNGDAAKIITEYNLGYNFGYDDQVTLKAKLEELIKSDVSSYNTWSSDLKDHPFSRYSLTKKLSQILNQY